MILPRPKSHNQRGGAHPDQILLIAIIITLIVGTAFLTGCVHHAIPILQPTATTTQETMFTPSSAAEQAPVPAAYQGLYNSLKTDMDNYDTTLAHQNTSTNYPIIFGA